MNLKGVNNRIHLLESEELQLKRELRNSIPSELITVKGRIRKTVVNRLATCQMELKKLNNEKTRLQYECTGSQEINHGARH